MNLYEIGLTWVGTSGQAHYLSLLVVAPRVEAACALAERVGRDEASTEIHVIAAKRLGGEEDRRPFGPGRQLVLFKEDRHDPA